LFAGVDTCGAPVLEASELASDPHLSQRQTIQKNGAVLSAAPSPRLSEHPDLVASLATRQSRPLKQVLGEAGFSEDEVALLEERKVVW
jgi:alpha-methylacyl-CoA racemase